MGITSMLAARGSEHGSGLGKVRYVIERTMIWFGHWRRLKMCYPGLFTNRLLAA
jgi:hypothetical protein